uniref:Uncharacterized protein n=1 Tax=Anguilla anguilla TaxID=7936 RepID=A0A0E9V9N6_ANGAN
MIHTFVWMLTTRYEACALYFNNS